MMKRVFLNLIIIIGVLFIANVNAQNPYVFPETFEHQHDWRAFENGKSLLELNGISLPSKYGYMEGLHQFKVNENVWLKTLTVSQVREGHPSQHIIAQKSLDAGETWSDWYEVEPEGPPMNTYGSFVKHPTTGRVFYMYLRGPEEDMHYSKECAEVMDIATFLGWFQGEPFRCYPHLVGKVVYRYVDEQGNFSKRYQLDLPMSQIDRENFFKGKYFVLYNVPTPRLIQGNDALSWCTKHGPIPRTGNGEAFLVRYKNYVNEDRLENIDIEIYPKTGSGFKHPEFSNAGSFGPIVMEDSFWFFKFRTVFARIGVAKSYDAGQSWDIDVMRYEPDGQPVKSPQGPFGFPKDPYGRMFFTWYNNSAKGFDDFSGRDLVYLSRAKIEDQELYISQPELVHYRQDQLGYANHTSERLNTPGFLERDGRLLGRISDKLGIRTFEMPKTFLDKLDSQWEINEIPREGIILDKTNPKNIDSPDLPALDENRGFTLSFVLNQNNLTAGQSLLENWDQNKGFKIAMSDRDNLLFTMSDGRNQVELTSDAGSLTSGQPHFVSIIVDGYPDLVTMVIDEWFQDGGKEKERGTIWFSHDFNQVNTEKNWQVNSNVISRLIVHDRFLLTTEAIGLHRKLRE